jgi:ceramide glucosyltransferase
VTGRGAARAREGMLFPVKIFLLLGAVLVIEGILSLLDGRRFLNYARRSLRTAPADFHPPTAVIVPVKGIDPGLETAIDRLFGQDYSDYRLIFAVASEHDPACTYLRERLRRYAPSLNLGPREARLVVAGASLERGEKVNNLIAALGAVSASARVLVFADADARPKMDWLRSLVAPLIDPAVTVSTGFRWYLPGESFASRLRAAWDASIATTLGDHRSNFAWGGSMAIRAEDFRRLRIAERYWNATVSDDYGVTLAVRDAGGRIRFEPRCLAASVEESTLGEFLRWSNRQIIITRVYAARLWRWGLLNYILFCGTLLLGVALILFPASRPVRLLAVAIEVLVLLLGISKAHLRAIVAREAFPEEASALRRHGSCYWQLWPLVPWVMLINFLTAGLTRRIEWRGTRYELISATKLRVLEPNERARSGESG